ncbi:MAG: hypothetical protein AB7I57_11265 [Pirellulales bacterium]
MLGVVVISLALLGISGWLIDSHRRNWREALSSNKIGDREKRFAGAMYRRRMLASSTIGATGAAIALWPVIPPRPMAITLYLAALLAACAWIMLLALVDFVATRHYYRRLRQEQLAKQVELAVEMASLCEAADAEGQTA